MSLFPSASTQRPLPYRRPTQGRDYWIIENALDNPDAVFQRCLTRNDWEYGFPTTGEAWPGMRARHALLPDEQMRLDEKVRACIGVRRLWVTETEDGARLNHNYVQAVGAAEGAIRPHTDSRDLCRYAAVLYLNPAVPDRCGTSFFRQRLGPGRLGGNVVMPPHRNLVAALGNRFVPSDAFAEDVRVTHKANRLLVYQANLIHSASAYAGVDLESRRMTAVFFWMA